MASALIEKNGDVVRQRFHRTDRRATKFAQHFQSGEILFNDRCSWRVIGARIIADHVEFTLRVAEPPRAHIYS